MPVIDPRAEPSALSAILVDAVREAGALALGMFGRELKTWTKNGTSPVCEADIAVDRLLRERLTAAAPDYGWRSEESGDDPARLAAKRVWIVDPIDGTRAYIRGMADWTIAAALVEAGRPVLGVIFAPPEAALYAAVAGRGARLNGTAIRASEGEKLDGARVAGPRRRLDQLAAIVPSIETVAKIQHAGRASGPAHAGRRGPAVEAGNGREQRGSDPGFLPERRGAQVRFAPGEAASGRVRARQGCDRVRRRAARRCEAPLPTHCCVPPHR
ncbi:MAG: 3'(2'),5'-bisphosphate nucleotidase CysQ [Alphaproteobacteria bacterium]|nr:MAG: 3'(2'),5'-bisphosphate nucleotidase CysQ [Alphaproteobacteria bacterium]